MTFVHGEVVKVSGWDRSGPRAVPALLTFSQLSNTGRWGPRDPLSFLGRARSVGCASNTLDMGNRNSGVTASERGSS